MSESMLLATRKGLLTFEKKSGAWKISNEAFVGAHVSYACRDPRTNTLWACLDHGHWGIKLHRSKDNGATWDEMKPPAMPEGSMIRDDAPASVKYLWAMIPGLPDQPGRLYLGTVPGGLFISNDDGESWSLCESLWNLDTRPKWFGGGMDEAGIHSLCIDPNDNKHYFIGISCAGVMETTDDGNTWAYRNKGLSAPFLPDPDTEVGHDPHILMASPSNSSVMWQQNHCGVFRTTDGAKTWTKISEGEGGVDFGFVITPDQSNEEVAWVIPAEADQRRVAIERKLFVARTDDGGKTWKRFTKGLPQENCYDFAFRHAMDIDSDTLAFGTAGGSCYFSEDRGESWQAIAKDLPPVYAVRFA